MWDGHFARNFANFKDFPGELLVFEDFQKGRRGKISGVSCRNEVKIPGVRSKFEEFSRTPDIL